MTREELFEALRGAYRSCDTPHVSAKYPYMYVSCTLCQPTMDGLMKIVDAYVEEHAGFPEIMGVKEAREATGLSQQRLHTAVRQGQLRVAQHLATGPVFTAEEVRRFITTPRPKGRPRKNRKEHEDSP